MRKITVTFALLLATTIAAPSFAAGMSSSAMAGNSMMAGSHSMMMKPGDTVVVMPNGETMMMPAMKGDMAMDMMKDATPVDGCLIFTMGKDGKMMMMHDMKMADGKMGCETMSMMKH